MAARLQAAKVHRSSSRSEREAELRAAQERAFEEVKKANGEADRRAAMHRAVEDLIDACESFIEAAGSTPSPRVA